MMMIIINNNNNNNNNNINNGNNNSNNNTNNNNNNSATVTVLIYSRCASQDTIWSGLCMLKFSFFRSIVEDSIREWDWLRKSEPSRTCYFLRVKQWQGSYRSWVTKFNDFSMTNLNFPRLRNTENPAFWEHILLGGLGEFFQFSNSTKSLDQKMKFHDFSMTSDIFPKIHDFSIPGKWIFEFHDFSWPYESWMKSIFAAKRHRSKFVKVIVILYLFPQNIISLSYISLRNSFVQLCKILHNFKNRTKTWLLLVQPWIHCPLYF